MPGAADTRAAAAALVLLLAAGARADDLADARARSAAGDYKGAEASYRAALKTKEDAAVGRELAAVLYNEAVLLGRHDDFAGTVPILTEALRLAPGLNDARIALALSYDKLGKKKEAAATYADIGRYYLQAASPTKASAAQAQQAFAEANARVPSAEYVVGEGDARIVQGDYHGALESYRKAEGKFKGPGLPRRMGDAFAGLGLQAQAIEQYDKAESADATPATALFLVRFYSEKEMWDRAIDEVAVAEKEGAKRDAALAFMLANAWYVKGLRQIEAKDEAGGGKSMESAVAAVDSVLAREPTPELYQVKGLALLMTKQFDAGAQALEAAIKVTKGPVGPQVYAALAAAYDKLGKADKAAEARKHLPPR